MSRNRDAKANTNASRTNRRRKRKRRSRAKAVQKARTLHQRNGTAKRDIPTIRDSGSIRFHDQKTHKRANRASSPSSSSSSSSSLRVDIFILFFSSIIALCRRLLLRPFCLASPATSLTAALLLLPCSSAFHLFPRLLASIGSLARPAAAGSVQFQMLHTHSLSWRTFSRLLAQPDGCAHGQQRRRLNPDERAHRRTRLCASHQTRISKLVSPSSVVKL